MQRAPVIGLLVILLGWQPSLAAQEEDATPPVSAEGEAVKQARRAFHEPGSAESEPELETSPDPELDLCHWDLDKGPWQEDTQELLRGASCYSFRWFDGLFGDSIDYPEQAINGRMLTGAEYTQYDGLDPRMRLRVRAELPNMSKRWDLLLGRGDEEAYISDTQAQDNVFYNPGLVNRNTDDTWLLGLGHRRQSLRRGWDWSAGVRLGFPIVPYVKSSWYYTHAWSQRTDFRFRQTFFWRTDDGLGSTSRGDYSLGLNPENVLRWEAVGTVSDATEDLKWYVGQTWYHLLGDRSAISLLAFARGETGAEVPDQEYGFNLIWRRPFTRDWMYLSLGPSLTWPRYFLHEQREASLGFGAWIEVEFGDWRY